MSQAHCRNYLHHVFKDKYSVYFNNLYKYITEDLKLTHDLPEISYFIDISRSVFRQTTAERYYASIDQLLLSDYPDVSKIYLGIFKHFRTYNYFASSFMHDDRQKATQIFITLLIHKLCDEIGRDDPEFKVTFTKFKDRYIN